MLKNENRHGYKKTKVGWVPKDWECSTFGETFQIQLGKMLNKQASAGTSQQPYLTNINVRWGSFDVSIIRTMSFSETEKAKFALKQGDLLVCEGGEIGRCAIWDEEIKPCYYQKALHRLRARKKSIEVRFAMHFLHQAFTSSRVHGLVGETSFAHFTKERFVDFPISVPPYPEQIAIAEVLECWDKAIQTLTLKIDKKRLTYKALSQKLISGQTRLPGYSKNWKTLRLGSAFNKIVGGGTPSKKEPLYWENGNIPWASVKDFSGHRLKKTQDFITPSGLKNSASNLIPKNTLLIATRMAVGKCLLTEIDTSINQDLKAVFLKDSMDTMFTFYLLNSLESHFDRIGTGSTVKGISLATLQNAICRFPPLKEQRAIAAVLSAADAEIEALEQKLALFKSQKRFLLNNLVTGTIRLPQFENSLP